MDFFTKEATDGVRWSWNILPATRLEASRMVVPTGALYTPLKAIEGLPLLQYDPVVCKTCRGVLNPYCRVDYHGSKLWICPFCYSRNQFPPHYADIDEQNRPAELYEQYTTVEYILQGRVAPPPVFIYVVDTCLSDDELDALRDSLLMSLNLLPDNAIVGLITFGTTVQIYELGYPDCNKAYVFSGTKELAVQQIQDQLGLRPPFGAGAQGRAPPPSLSGANQQATGASRFLQPLSECEFTLTNIIEELQHDPWIVPSDSRSCRCTGAALSAAISLLESTYPNTGARIMMFLGGPCTVGPGMVVETKLADQIRLHNDLKTNSSSARHFKNAVKYYQGLTQRAVNAGHAIDIFACNLDQVGVLEMKSCTDETGGVLFITEAFSEPIFKQTFQRFFARSDDNSLKMAFEGILEVQASRELKVSGAIGPMSSLKKKTPLVGETVIGHGNTSAWKMNALDPNTTVAIYFEVANQQPTQSQGNFRYVQFITRYQHSSGTYRLRVSTVALRWVDAGRWLDIAQGFDQEAATVLVARQAVWKADAEQYNVFDVLRWLDRILIRLVAKFGDYQKNEPNSLRLASNFSLYPQFMFHLRRSQFLQVFNSSPDETAYFRSTLERANTTNSLIMIQPTLHAYSFNGPPHPVMLDSTSVSPENILLLDTFFIVLIHTGSVSIF
eukprot:GEZU01027552.1.p1 GENE.GEZU01027552.1~~GEZU01027552.1.p1  ORF type:complete len:670 (-),score=209.29 GEZU01027552.1:37-2046(-)